MKSISPAKFMSDALLGINDGLSIRKSKYGDIFNYQSPIGNISVLIAGELLTGVEYDLLKKFIEMARVYDEGSKVYSLHLKKVRDPFRDMRNTPISKLDGRISQFSLQELMDNHSDPAVQWLNDERLAMLIEKLTRMLIELNLKARSRCVMSGFRPINEFSRVDNRYLIHFEESFVPWINKKTTWLDIYQRSYDRSKLALTI